MHWTKSSSCRIRLSWATVALLLLPLTVGSTVAALAADWKDKLKKDLQAAYPHTKISFLDPDRVTKPGIVLVVRKEGITADPSSDARTSMTFVRDGQLQQQGGITAALFTKENSRVFKAGEKVYLIRSYIRDEQIELILLSGEMFAYTKGGSTHQTRYKGGLVFEFPKGYLETADFAKITALITTVLSSEAEATSSEAKTIALGQTQEEVERAMGKPDKIINLGSKVTYIYKDMKIIFVDGKVADVQ